MANTFSLYPQLNEELLSRFRFNASEYEFFYESEGMDYPLRTESIDGSTVMGSLVDERGLWTPDQYNFGFRRDYDCMSCMNLFGPSGIACRDAIIGVAVIWTSAQSRQRGTIKVGTLKNTLKPQHLSIEYSFETAQFRGSVEFNTVLYIEKPSEHPDKDERHLSNCRGYQLGEIGDKFILQLDGSGSMFPIYEEQRPGQPLWRVKCDWEDVSYNSFNESVKIFFNRSHPAYKFIDKSSKKYNPYLLLEVMASALTDIIMDIKMDDAAWNEIEQGRDPQSGSISEAVRYFSNTLEWNMDNPKVLSLSIREFLGKRM